MVSEPSSHATVLTLFSHTTEVLVHRVCAFDSDLTDLVLPDEGQSLISFD